MYGERSICTIAQKTAATATTVRTIEALAIALLLRGNICIECAVFTCKEAGNRRFRNRVRMSYVTHFGDQRY
jgi:hypothetical protein